MWPGSADMARRDPNPRERQLTGQASYRSQVPINRQCMRKYLVLICILFLGCATPKKTDIYQGARYHIYYNQFIRK